MNRGRQSKRGAVLVVAVVFAGLIVGWGVASPRAQTDMATEFKYGSIGTEETVGVPYWLWKVLPEVFADKLPNRAGSGYERVGFTYESPTHDLPMGATKSRDWIPRVGLNCATCHAGAYREAPDAAPTVVLGMPAHQMDLVVLPKP